MKLADVKAALRNGPYAWPGGYPMFFVTQCGAPLSFEAVRKHWADVCRAHLRRACCREDRAWIIAACEINWEDADLYCDETGQRIESAYAED
jgi:hypothetical protein